MAITGRVPLLLLLGLAAVVLRPSIGTMWLWVLVVLLLVGLDVALAPSPARITVERLPVDRVRAGLESASTLAVGNDGTRRTTVLVRDAWQPTAGATGNRHRLLGKATNRGPDAVEFGNRGLAMRAVLLMIVQPLAVAFGDLLQHFID